jgi:hypothetical protein
MNEKAKRRLTGFVIIAASLTLPGFSKASQVVPYETSPCNKTSRQPSTCATSSCGISTGASSQHPAGELSVSKLSYHCLNTPLPEARLRHCAEMLLNAMGLH